MRVWFQSSECIISGNFHVVKRLYTVHTSQYDYSMSNNNGNKFSYACM